jgi:hypothetical protein
MRYLLFFPLLLISLTLNASEMSEEVEEELKRAIDSVLPPVVYDPKQEKYSLKIDVDYVDSIAESGFAALPTELIISIIKYSVLDSSTLLSLKTTSKYFNEISSNISYFYLNPYCLQEGMPRTIPREILNFKVENTQNGLLKLASLYSVFSRQLAEWFNEGYLRKIIGEFDIPNSIENFTENEIAELYPKMKILLAIDPSIDMDDIRRSVYAERSISFSIDGVKLLSLIDADVIFGGHHINNMLSAPSPNILDVEYGSDAPALKLSLERLLFEEYGSSRLGNCIFSLWQEGISIEPLLDWSAKYSDDFRVLSACADYCVEVGNEERAVQLWIRMLNETGDENINHGDHYYSIKAALELLERESTHDVPSDKIRDFAWKYKNRLLQEDFMDFSAFPLLVHYDWLSENQITNILARSSNQEFYMIEYGLTKLSAALWRHEQFDLAEIVTNWIIEHDDEGSITFGGFLFFSQNEHAKDYLKSLLSGEYYQSSISVWYMLSKLCIEDEILQLITDNKLIENHSFEGKLSLALTYYNIGQYNNCELYLDELKDFVNVGDKVTKAHAREYTKKFIKKGSIELNAISSIFDLPMETIFNGINTIENDDIIDF